MKKKVACIIPARLASQRFPEKVLTTLAGRPMLSWIWQTATESKMFDSIFFAVDAPQTAQLVQSFGGRSIMTPPECPSGTDRVIEVVNSGALRADIIVNWQGDSPLVSTRMIGDLLQTCDKDDADVWTLKKKITDQSEVTDPNVVKVVCDQNETALYFSRSTIPYYRDTLPFVQCDYFKHIGLYAYTTDALLRIDSFSPSPYEQAEKLEQLRFMHHGLKIRVHETSEDGIEVNMPEDLRRAEEFVRAIKN